MENTKPEHTIILSDTKEKIRNRILEEKQLIEKQAQTDAAHSSAYYYSLYRLIDEFVNKLDNTILFKKLEPGWQYTYDVSYEGATLYVEHLDYWGEDENNFPVYFHDQQFILFSIPARFLTVEEYAKQYKVADVTVRQWIRRAKIRTARKFGSEWRISELTDPPKRGYTDGDYMWENPLPFLPEEFSYLKGFCEIHITQCKERQKYKVFLKKDRDAFYFDKELEISTTERERLELFLIGNPEIKLRQNITEAPVWDLIRCYDYEKEDHTE